MIYVYHFVIPANTAFETRVSEEMVLTSGTINRVDVCFPSGCAGLVSCRILSGITQIWPSNPDAWFSYDDATVSWSEDYELDDPSEVLTFEAYNEDDTYDHEITIRLHVTRPISRDVMSELLELIA